MCRRSVVGGGGVQFNSETTIQYIELSIEGCLNSNRRPDLVWGVGPRNF